MALLLVNDHILKARFPGAWTTGKLSDAAWLVVAPLVAAAVLAMLKVRPRWAIGTALASTALAFLTLQLWPPLGNAWVSVMGGAHVADPADLLMLPALLLAPLAWRQSAARTAAPVRRIGFLVGAGALMATSYVPDERNPCPEALDWDPARPLALRWSHRRVPENPELVKTGISIQTESGASVPFDVYIIDHHGVLICPIGGLEPSTTYIWKVGNFQDLGDHVNNVPWFTEEGRWTFTTADTPTWTGSCDNPQQAWQGTDSCTFDSGVQ